MVERAARDPVARALQCVLALSGHAMDGLRLSQVAREIGEIDSTALRALRSLEAAGWAERVPGAEDRWRLSPRPVQIAYAHQAELERLQRRLEDLRITYTRTPN